MKTTFAPANGKPLSNCGENKQQHNTFARHIIKRANPWLHPQKTKLRHSLDQFSSLVFPAESGRCFLSSIKRRQQRRGTTNDSGREQGCVYIDIALRELTWGPTVPSQAHKEGTTWYNHTTVQQRRRQPIHGCKSNAFPIAQSHVSNLQREMGHQAIFLHV